MSSEELLAKCGFASAEEVAALDGKFPGRPRRRPRSEYDIRGVRYVRTVSRRAEEKDGRAE